MEENKVEYFKLSPELAQAIVNYMASRPYQEVYQVMPAIMNLEPVLSEVSQEEADKDILGSDEDSAEADS